MTDLVDKVKEAGIIGCGGAGFPTHVKINTRVDYVIANAAECEPLIESDISLITHKTKQILEGLSLVVNHVGAKKGIIGIKEKHKNAVKIINEELKNYKNLEIKLLQDFYPAGDEFILVYEVLGLHVPERGIPLEVGCIVSNVGTLYQINNANYGIPYTSRLVTVSGEVKNPKVLHVPIGTSFEDLIKACGGKSRNDAVILHNGPMMGSLTGSHVLKTTSAIILLPPYHPVIISNKTNITTRYKISQSVCDQCMNCTYVCSRGLLGHKLEPHKIVRAVNCGIYKDIPSITSALLCSECRLCEVYCDLKISPCDINREIKKQFGILGMPPKPSLRKIEVNPMREYRKVSTKRLMGRLDLNKYDIHLPIDLNLMDVKEVNLPLKQHLGVPSIPVVKEGDFVNKGDIIANIPEGKLGAKIHASISGKIIKITDSIVIRS